VDVQIGPGSLQNDNMSMIDLCFCMFFLLFANTIFLSHERKNGGDSDFEIAVKERRQKCLLFHRNGHPPSNAKQFRSYGSF
jgi:hypothetical protein